MRQTKELIFLWLVLSVLSLCKTAQSLGSLTMEPRFPSAVRQGTCLRFYYMQLKHANLLFECGIIGDWKSCLSSFVDVIKKVENSYIPTK